MLTIKNYYTNIVIFEYLNKYKRKISTKQFVKKTTDCIDYIDCKILFLLMKY